MFISDTRDATLHGAPVFHVELGQRLNDLLHAILGRWDQRTPASASRAASGLMRPINNYSVLMITTTKQRVMDVVSTVVFDLSTECVILFV